MKKIIRNIFSGYFLVIFLLILELGGLIFINFFLDDTVSYFNPELAKQSQINDIVSWIYVGVRLLTLIVAIIIFFRIINKNEDPEFKIPWIIGMILLPLFSAVLYLVFANHGLRKKDRRVIEATHQVCNEIFAYDERNKELYNQELGRAGGAFKFIHRVTSLGIHNHNRVTYYKCGEEFFPELVESLKKAKEFIFIEFFIIADGKQWSLVKDILIEKAKQGVEVVIIYDDMGCGGTISARTPRRLAKYGIRCYKFHPFRPILSGVYNNRDHRKIVVIDHQMAFTGGMNLADEYANDIRRFGYWKDTMIKVEGSAINNLIMIFFQNLDLATGKISNYKKYLTDDYPAYEDEGFIMPFGDGPGSIDNSLIGEQTYINILNYAQKSVYISTPYLIPTYGLIDAMRNAALRGVDVHLIIPGIPDKKLVYMISKSNIPYLQEAGVKVYFYTPGFNHMKSAIADGELGFVGTINFDFRSLVHHFECGALLYKCPCMKDIEQDFLEMLEHCEKVPDNFKLKRGQKSIVNLCKIFTPLF